MEQGLEPGEVVGEQQVVELCLACRVAVRNRDVDLLPKGFVGEPSARNAHKGHAAPVGGVIYKAAFRGEHCIQIGVGVARGPVSIFGYPGEEGMWASLSLWSKPMMIPSLGCWLHQFLRRPIPCFQTTIWPFFFLACRQTFRSTRQEETNIGRLIVVAIVFADLVNSVLSDHNMALFLLRWQTSGKFDLGLARTTRRVVMHQTSFGQIHLAHVSNSR